MTVEISVVETIDASVAATVRDVLERALEPELRDDRFDGWPEAGPPTGYRAALALVDGRPAGYLGATASGRRVALDALVVPAGGAEADLLGDLFDRLVETGTLDPPSVDAIELWARPARPWHDELARNRGLSPWRTLHQMRCPLPVDAEPLPTRAFRSGDRAELRAVNNRAFATHPDQGDLSLADLRETMASPWFRPEGLRIHERDGRIAGFCWTKIHPSPPAPTELGEIYVIGVDPDYHGQGMGVPMTAAGLSWLAEQGITTGMLYVEGDNVPAIRTYERLGFTIHRTDRAWLSADLDPGPAS